jgi:hypothetical protein
LVVTSDAPGSPHGAPLTGSGTSPANAVGVRGNYIISGSVKVQ